MIILEWNRQSRGCRPYDFSRLSWKWWREHFRNRRHGCTGSYSRRQPLLLPCFEAVRGLLLAVLARFNAFELLFNGGEELAYVLPPVMAYLLSISRGCQPVKPVVGIQHAYSSSPIHHCKTWRIHNIEKKRWKGVRPSYYLVWEALFTPKHTEKRTQYTGK